ncbi:hypothetical protein LV779_07035 [Streptomyces thinghirensis]|nr:hypothetical protein [Streptomyces thinghirensis]
MSQDVRFDLPFDTPSACISPTRGTVICAGCASGAGAQPGRIRGVPARDLAQAAARTYPHASADDMVVLMNWFSLAFLFDDQFDAGRPDRAERIAEVARELIATPLRPAGTPPRWNAPSRWPGRRSGPASRMACP